MLLLLLLLAALLRCALLPSLLPQRQRWGVGQRRCLLPLLPLHCLLQPQGSVSHQAQGARQWPQGCPQQPHTHPPQHQPQAGWGILHLCHWR